MKSQQRKVLTEIARQQNEIPQMKCLREFMRSSQALEKYLDQKLGNSPFNRTQRRLVMILLYKDKPMTPTELSKMTFSPIDRINKSLDSLDKMGLTRSYRSNKDRRVRKVTLMKSGLDVIEEFLPLRYQVFSKILENFNDEELSWLSHINEKLTAEICRLTESDNP